MDKSALLAEIIIYMKEQCASSRQIAKGAIDSAAEQEGRNQTRYDTMRIEGSWLADGIASRFNALEEELSRAENYSLPVQNGMIAQGSLAKLKNPSLGQRLFFILPFSPGYTRNVEGIDMIVVSANAPIMDAMRNRREGETFQFRGNTYLIEEIF